MVLGPAPIDLGVAGGLARAEFERRHQKREDRVREAYPKIGGLLLALFDDPQSTQAWRKGGVGEQKVGARFSKVGDTVIALHDRCVPGSRANIDHIVIGPSGVFVVDTKRYAGAKIALRRSGGFLSPYREQLVVGGRDQAKMVEAMEWQVSAVRTALFGSQFADVPMSAVLCFVDGELPALREDRHRRRPGPRAEGIRAARRRRRAVGQRPARTDRSVSGRGPTGQEDAEHVGVPTRRRMRRLGDA